MSDVDSELRRAMRQRILVIDGAMGTTIRGYGLTEADARGERFKANKQDLLNNGDILSLTRPDVIEDIHRRFLEAGADIIETNTFGATNISQSDLFIEDPRDRGGARIRNFFNRSSRTSSSAKSFGTSTTSPRFSAGNGPTGWAPTPDANATWRVRSGR